MEGKQFRSLQKPSATWIDQSPMLRGRSERSKNCSSLIGHRYHAVHQGNPKKGRAPNQWEELKGSDSDPCYTLLLRAQGFFHKQSKKTGLVGCLACKGNWRHSSLSTASPQSDHALRLRHERLPDCLWLMGSSFHAKR